MAQAKTFRNLGERTGDVLLFGGCYSNAAATRALFDAAVARGISPGNLICTGDVCGYCADTAKTIEMVRNSGCMVIAGNVERQLAEGAADCGCGFEEGTTCNRLSRDWYGHAQGTVSTTDTSWMAELPDFAVFQAFGKRYAVVHGGASDISRFLWPTSTEMEFQEEAQLLAERLGPIDGVIAGHCGVPFHRQIDSLDWINAGAVGLPPNDGRPMTRYAVLNERGVVFHRLEYAVDESIDAMKQAGLTQGYDAALRTGFWPSEDVLPAEMRQNA